MRGRLVAILTQWHEQVNFCAPTAGGKRELMAPHPQFGLRGSITTQEVCDVIPSNAGDLHSDWDPRHSSF